MEKTVSGIKVEGDWKEVVESGEKVSNALKNSVGSDDIEEWEYWRPKNNEDIKKDVKYKTVEIACVNESKIEESNESIKQETKKGLARIKESLKIKNPKKNFKSGINKLLSTLNAVSRKFFRAIEKPIYKYIISKTNPQYFDSEKVSASLDEKKNLLKNREEKEYIMRVNINDEELCKEVQEDLE